MSTVKKKIVKKVIVKKEAVKKVVVKKKEVATKKKVVAKKTPTKKKVVAKTTPPKKVKKTREETPNSLCRKLLLEKKHTDTVIFDRVKKTFPKSNFKRSWIASKRYDLWADGTVKEGLKPIAEKKEKKASVPSTKKSAKTS